MKSRRDEETLWRLPAAFLYTCSFRRSFLLWTLCMTFLARPLPLDTKCYVRAAPNGYKGSRSARFKRVQEACMPYRRCSSACSAATRDDVYTCSLHDGGGGDDYKAFRQPKTDALPTNLPLRATPLGLNLPLFYKHGAWRIIGAERRRYLNLFFVYARRPVAHALPPCHLSRAISLGTIGKLSMPTMVDNIFPQEHHSVGPGLPCDRHCFAVVGCL